jgi:hypothetical protein
VVVALALTRALLRRVDLAVVVVAHKPPQDRVFSGRVVLAVRVDLVLAAEAVVLVGLVPLVVLLVVLGAMA